MCDSVVNSLHALMGCMPEFGTPGAEGSQNFS